MSTWADIAAKNAPPESEQPHPDQSLLEGGFEGSEAVAVPGSGVEHGLTVVPNDFKDHPETITTDTIPATVQRDADFAKSEAAKAKETAESEAAELEAKAKETAQEVKEGAHELKKDVSAKANEAGKEFSAKANQAGKDISAKASQAGKDIKAKAGEAEEFLSEEARKAKKFAEKEGKIIKKESASLYRSLVNALSQPKYFVPLISTLDVALLGFIGYRAYQQKQARIPFDRRVVSAVAVGLGAWFSVETVAANAYFSKRDWNGNPKL